MITTFFYIDESPVRCSIADPMESVERNRRWQRQQRLAFLEPLFPSKVFDDAFLTMHKDDPALRLEFTNDKMAARAAVLAYRAEQS